MTRGCVRVCPRTYRNANPAPLPPFSTQRLRFLVFPTRAFLSFSNAGSVRRVCFLKLSFQYLRVGLLEIMFDCVKMKQERLDYIMFHFEQNPKHWRRKNNQSVKFDSWIHFVSPRDASIRIYVASSIFGASQQLYRQNIVEISHWSCNKKRNRLDFF